VKRRKHKFHVDSMLCDPRRRQKWQPTRDEVAKGLAYFREKMLPAFPVITDPEEVEAAAQIQFDPKDEEAYFITPAGLGEIIALNAYPDQNEKCPTCASNVGMLVVRIAEREGDIAIIDKTATGPGQPLSVVFKVGGAVQAKTDRPITDHGAWFIWHDETTGEIQALVCESCAFRGVRS
jgi:hypothetical protein